MKKTALFVNTGRGSTVDKTALIKALQEGWIAGAGLDVLETEPVGHNNPLLGMDSVILTSHVASASAISSRLTRLELPSATERKTSLHITPLRAYSTMIMKGC